MIIKEVGKRYKLVPADEEVVAEAASSEVAVETEMDAKAAKKAAKAAKKAAKNNRE